MNAEENIRNLKQMKEDLLLVKKRMDWATDKHVKCLMVLRELYSNFYFVKETPVELIQQIEELLNV